MPVDQANKELPYCVLDVVTGSPECNTVMQKIWGKKNNYTEIVKIKRIQNPTSYGLYDTRRKTMEKQNPHCQNEKKLFHEKKK